MILGSGLELGKVQTAASKYLEFFQKLVELAIVPRVWVKRVSSVIVIVYLVYSVLWFGGSVKYIRF